MHKRQILCRCSFRFFRSRQGQLINSSVGFFEKDSFVYYLHNGSPIYCHDKNDLNSYRFIVANLITTNLCTATELSRALGVSNRNMCNAMPRHCVQKVQNGFSIGPTNKTMPISSPPISCLKHRVYLTNPFLYWALQGNLG